MINIFHIFYNTFLILNVLFLSGYAITCILLKNLFLTEEELIGFSIVTSSVIIGTLAAFFHLFPFENIRIISQSIIYIFIFFNSIFFIKKKAIILSVLKSKIFKYYFFILIHALLISMILPIFAGGFWWGDWYSIFSVAQSYQPNGVLTLDAAARTPLFNLIPTFFLNAFGGEFWVFQIVCVILNSSFALSLFLLAKRLFGDDILKFLFIFVFFNSWTIHEQWYPGAKAFTAYFTLLSLYFYLKFRENLFETDCKISKYYILSSIVAAIAYMAHPLALFYIIGVMADIFFIAVIKKSYKISFKIIFIYLIGLILIASLFYIGLLFKWSFSEIINASPAVSFNVEQRKFLFNIILGRIINGMFSFLPYTLPHLYLNEREIYSFNKFFEYYIDLHFNPIMGAVTLTGCIILIICIVKHLTNKKNITKLIEKYFLYRLNKVIGIVSVTLIFSGIILNRVISYFGDGLPLNLYDYFGNREKGLIQNSLLVLGIGLLFLWIYGKTISKNYKPNIPLNLLIKDFLINSKHAPIVIIFFFVYSISVYVMPWVIIPHGIASAAFVQMVFVIFIYLSNMLTNINPLLRKAALTFIILEYISVTWGHKYMLLSKTMWNNDANYKLKAQGSLVFAKDYIGEFWWVCLVSLIIFEILVVSYVGCFNLKRSAAELK